MKIKPISIKIHDNWKFGEIAFLVDREDFLKDVAKARKKLGIETPIPYKEVDGWLKKELDKKIKKTPVKKKKGLRGEKTFLFPATASDYITNKLLKKYKKTTNFFLPILHAILCGTVTKDEFSKSAYCQVLYPEHQVESYVHKTAEPKIAIIITPDTKIEEVENLYQTEIPKAINEYKQIVLKTKRSAPDTISNIKRDRKWYWWKQSLSYGQVHKKAQDGGETITRDGVIKAIKQYKARVTMEL